MNAEFLAVIEFWEREKGIRKEVLIAAVEEALLSAAKKAVGPARDLRCVIDPKSGDIKAFAKLQVAERVVSKHDQISQFDARRIKPDVSEVFVYYVGHGAPDLSTGEAYLMPSDADPNYPATSYRITELYRSLEQLPARQVTVILDACFSGRVGRGNRVEMLMAGARGIAVEPKQARPGEATVVFTASAGNQVSSGFPEKTHGLFTYYLLLGLAGEADSDGDRSVTVQELYAYARQRVMSEAGRLDREQTPELIGADPGRVLVRY